MKKTDHPRQENVTMADVAEEAGVSVASVSNVINESLPVSDKIKKRVKKAINTLGYQQNLAARSLKTGVSNIIGLLVPNLSNPFFSELAKHIIDSARDKGYIISVIDTQNSTEKELKSLDFLFLHGVQSVIWFDPRSDHEAITQHTRGHQVVIVDRHLEGFDSIVPEYERGGYALGQYAISQRHKRIGLISGPQVNYGARMRRKGILSALEGKSEIVWECENSFSETLSRNALKHVLERDVSLIMCGNDLIAVGTLLALNSANIDVPGEISITGFDDIHLCEIVSPKLTSVSLPMASTANEAVTIAIEGARGIRSPKKHLSLGLELKVRESVSPCARKVDEPSTP